MHKKILLVILMSTILIGGYFLFPQKIDDKENGFDLQIPKNESLSIVDSTNMNFTAGFAIFTNGTFRDFSDTKYHNLSKDVFIELDNPNIIQVRKEGITWDDFFMTLPFALNKDCLITGTGQTFCDGEGGQLRFLLNGAEDASALFKSINKDDYLLVTFGNDSAEEISDQLRMLRNLSLN